ncbi:hypothetical protein ACB092_03G026400 [Castanea dentata]
MIEASQLLIKIWFLGVRDQLEIDAIASCVPWRTTEPNMPIMKFMLILLKKWMQLLTGVRSDWA